MRNYQNIIVKDKKYKAFPADESLTCNGCDLEQSITGVSCITLPKKVRCIPALRKDAAWIIWKEVTNNA